MPVSITYRQSKISVPSLACVMSASASRSNVQIAKRIAVSHIDYAPLVFLVETVMLHNERESLYEIESRVSGEIKCLLRQLLSTSNPYPFIKPSFKLI